jgi:hypothetical protein
MDRSATGTAAPDVPHALSRVTEEKGMNDGLLCAGLKQSDDARLHDAQAARRLVHRSPKGEGGRPQGEAGLFDN